MTRLKIVEDIVRWQMAVIEQLKIELHSCRRRNGILRRQIHQLRKDHAKERVKLKREIELLRQSP